MRYAKTCWNYLNEIEKYLCEIIFYLTKIIS